MVWFAQVFYVPFLMRLSRKCVIIDAYSNVNPQVAAQWSANITSWGMTLLPTVELSDLVLTE
jgi:hypothetical protein